jgi:hypothetical protein
MTGTDTLLGIDREELMAWAVPAAIVFGAAAVLVLVTIWTVRRARRSRRARGRARQQLDEVGTRLVALDDALGELELELALSGALYGGDPPAGLRRTRMTASHARDDAFAEYRLLQDSDELLPAAIRRRARALRERVEKALRAVETAVTEHDAWVAEHVSAPEQIAAAAARLEAARARMGDPSELLGELAGFADHSEWEEAEIAADGARDALETAQELLDEAARRADDPTLSALDALAGAERALQRAEHLSRILEERHRLVMQARLAMSDELAATAAAIRAATGIRAGLEPADAARLGEAIAAASDELDALTARAARHPVSTNERIARLRDRLDMALADARTAQQRLLGARSALPGALAAARSALTRAEAAMHAGASLDARLRIDAARAALADARQSHDPVAALDEARRAIRHAEDAKALADGDGARPGR